MIIDIEAKVQLDKKECDEAQSLIQEFVEKYRSVTRIELASNDVARSRWGDFGEFSGVDRVGIDVKVQAFGPTGIEAVLELMEALGRYGPAAATGAPDAACEPSTRDRLFYKPKSITFSDGETRHFSPPNPPFEPCPATDDRGFGGKVVKATHQAPRPKEDGSSQDGS